MRKEEGASHESAARQERRGVPEVSGYSLRIFLPDVWGTEDGVFLCTLESADFYVKTGKDDDIFIIFEREHRVKKTEDNFFLRVYIRTGRARIQFF